MGKIRILAMVFSGCLLITGAGWSLQIYQGYRKGRTEYQELADVFTSGSEIKSGYFGKPSSDRGRGKKLLLREAGESCRQMRLKGFLSSGLSYWRKTAM